MKTITSLSELREFLATLPEGAGVDILASDLEAGNFETAHVFMPEGQDDFDIEYTGPVAEGYISPFEAVSEEADPRAEYSAALRALKWD